MEWECEPSPGECTRLTNYFREFVPSFTTACSGASMSGTTVAINSDNDYLHCGDRVCIVGHGEKTVTDFGGGLTLTQLDHYLPGYHSCVVPNDFCAQTTTIKLYD